MNPKSIDCECGTEIDIEDVLADACYEALRDGEGSDLANDVVCDKCSAVYQVCVTTDVHVDISITNIELLSQGVVMDGKMISINQLGIGDSAELPDGAYQAGSVMYEISDGVVVAIYNSEIDENQLSLAI
ncbi:MAG: hypothetical protein RR595_13805 [Lysinibacillus sp.]